MHSTFQKNKTPGPKAGFFINLQQLKKGVGKMCDFYKKCKCNRLLGSFRCQQNIEKGRCPVGGEVGECQGREEIILKKDGVGEEVIVLKITPNAGVKKRSYNTMFHANKEARSGHFVS